MDPLDKAILVSIYSSGFDSGITPYDYFKSRTVVPEDLIEYRLGVVHHSPVEMHIQRSVIC